MPIDCEIDIPSSRYDKLTRRASIAINERVNDEELAKESRCPTRKSSDPRGRKRSTMLSSPEWAAERRSRWREIGDHDGVRSVITMA